jgi:hypothetical protein
MCLGQRIVLTTVYVGKVLILYKIVCSEKVFEEVRIYEIILVQLFFKF